MRFQYILLFGLSAQFSSAQTYSFEFLTKYDSDFGDHKHENVVYSDPDETTYFMYLMKYDTGTLARITDFSRRVIHVFSVNESKAENGETLFDFSYQESIDFGNAKPKECKVVYDSQVIASDSISKTIVVRQFKNSKKKKVLTTVTLEMKNHERNLLRCSVSVVGTAWNGRIGNCCRKPVWSNRLSLCIRSLSTKPNFPISNRPFLSCRFRPN